MEPAEIVKLALQVSIMLTVFGFGLRATVQDALYLVRHPRMLVISLVSMLIVMPFIALALVLVFDPPQLARVALVALALSPVPPILLTRQRKAGGQASYGLGLTAAVSILSIVLVPALVAFLGQLMGRPFELGPAAVAGQVVGGRGAAPGSGDAGARCPAPRGRPAEKTGGAGGQCGAVGGGRGGARRRVPEARTDLHCRHRRGHYRPYGAGAGLRPPFGRTGPWDSAVLALASAVRHPGIAWRSRARTSRRWMSGR
jgi:hypothetical protein